MRRKQLPLSLGYATTIHKVQGLTLPGVATSLTKALRAMSYVVLSRVKTLQTLHMATPFTMQQLTINKPTGALRNELDRLQLQSELTKARFDAIVEE